MIQLGSTPTPPVNVKHALYFLEGMCFVLGGLFTVMIQLVWTILKGRTQ